MIRIYPMEAGRKLPPSPSLASPHLFSRDSSWRDRAFEREGNGGREPPNALALSGRRPAPLTRGRAVVAGPLQRLVRVHSQPQEIQFVRRQLPREPGVESPPDIHEGLNRDSRDP